MSDPQKAWKHNPNDLKESELWDEYMKAYEDVLIRAAFPGTLCLQKQWYRNYY